jgi:K+-transporting ATPase ATPase C chain
VKDWLRQLLPAVMSTIVLGVICCGIYPLIVWGIAQAAFPAKANGSLIERNGQVVGSTLIGQMFTDAKYFHPRPSAAGNGYDATSSGGTNLGPTSAKLLQAVRERVAAYRAENGLSDDQPVPADAVTSSGSGLDPHISPANARLQLPRVAQARGMTAEAVATLIDASTDGRGLGFLGEPGVNVVRLNLALENAATH